MMSKKKTLGVSIIAVVVVLGVLLYAVWRGRSDSYSFSSSFPCEYIAYDDAADPPAVTIAMQTGQGRKTVSVRVTRDDARRKLRSGTEEYSGIMVLGDVPKTVIDEWHAAMSDLDAMDIISGRYGDVSRYLEVGDVF